MVFSVFSNVAQKMDELIGYSSFGAFLFFIKKSTITKLAIKNGMQGIFKRTRVPKFEMETPTDKAKKMAKINEKRASGCERSKTKNNKRAV